MAAYTDLARVFYHARRLDFILMHLTGFLVLAAAAVHLLGLAFATASPIEEGTTTIFKLSFESIGLHYSPC